MRSAQCFTVDHRQPVCRYLARFHQCCVHVSRIDPKPELHSAGVYRIGKIFEPVGELLPVLLIVTESLRPVIHAWNNRCTFVPGGIVIEDIESYSLSKTHFAKNRYFAVLFGEP